MELAEIIGRQFRFERADGSLIADCISLLPSGRIAGYHHSNEASWSFSDNEIHFKSIDGRVTTRFHKAVNAPEGKVYLGSFVGSTDPGWHVLRAKSKTIISEMSESLYGGEPPTRYADEEDSDDGYPHTNLQRIVVDAILDVVRPNFWLEIGSMLGGSAIRAANGIKEHQLNTQIICIDPFTGDVNMWDWEQGKKEKKEWQFLNLRRGRPSIFDRFLANVSKSGHLDIILPIQITSIVGVKLISRLYAQGRITQLPQVIYLDSAHEPEETLLELKNCWSVLQSGGVLVGDDWGWQAVREDVSRFVSVVSTNNLLMEKFMSRNPGFVCKDRILLDSGQWLICKP